MHSSSSSYYSTYLYYKNFKIEINDYYFHCFLFFFYMFYTNIFNSIN
jgi:hypothetical protein